MSLRRYAGILALGVVVATSSCGGLAAKGEAEAAVARFHQMLNAEQYAEIYDGTDELFKGASSRSQFVAILEAVHRKLGVVRVSTQRSFYSQDRAGLNAGSYLSMTYDTAFAEGSATESFNWRVVDGKVRLAGYNISSPLLITR